MKVSQFRLVQQSTVIFGVLALLAATTLPVTATASPAAPTTRAGTSEWARVESTGQQVTVETGSRSPSLARDGYTVTLPAVKPVTRSSTPVLSEAALTLLSAGVGADGKKYSYDPFSPGPIGWPFPGGAPISSSFGARHVTDCSFCTTFHDGVDFDPADKTPIHAIAGGVVKVAGDYFGYGQAVVIDSVVGKLTFETTYGHMTMKSITVKVGAKVRFGQIIGKVGDTGHATGPHLHLGISVNNKWVDPLAWLNKHANK